MLDCRLIAWGRGAHSIGGFGIRPGLGSLESEMSRKSLFDTQKVIKVINYYRELQQLLDSGERGVLAVEDDCRRNLLRLRGLPSRSWLRSGDK